MLKIRDGELEKALAELELKLPAARIGRRVKESGGGQERSSFGQGMGAEVWEALNPTVNGRKQTERYKFTK